VGSDPANTSRYTPPSGTSFNSTGGTNTIQRNSVGNYTVTLPGLTKPGGDAQVVGQKESPHAVTPRCKAVGWAPVSGGTNITVQCFGKLGASRDQIFWLAYSVGEPLGVMPGAKTLGSVGVRKRSDEHERLYADPESSIQRLRNWPPDRAKNRYWPVHRYHPWHAQLRHFCCPSHGGCGNGSAYCNIVAWTGSAINVACYRQGGVPADSRFEMSFQTAN